MGVQRTVHPKRVDGGNPELVTVVGLYGRRKLLGTLPRVPLIIILIVLILVFGGGYYMGPCLGYYGGGGLSLVLAAILLYLIFGRGRRL